MPASLTRFRGSPRAWLVLLIFASSALRFLAAWFKTSPIYLPDEYIYTSLARNLFSHGEVIRGQPYHFLSLLQPILTAPAWSWFAPDTAYRVVQGMNGVFFSLAAVPVYLLARQLGLTTRLAFACAVIALLLPDLGYAGYIQSEAVAYPLAMAAFYCGVLALAEPRRWSQIGFVILCALLVFTRVQFIVLPLAFVVAVVALAVCERELRKAFGRQLLTLGPFFLLAFVGLAWKGTGVLGYGAVASWRPQPAALLTWVGKDLYALMWDSGLVLLGGCLLGLGYSLLRPRLRSERAFALLLLPFAVLTLVEGAYYAVSVPLLGAEVHGRYIFYLAPLVAIGFALYAARGFPRAIALVSLSVAAVVAVNFWSLSQLAGEGFDDSQLLLAVHELDLRLGGAFFSRPYLFLFAILALMLTALAAGQQVRWATQAILGVAMLVLATASVAAAFGNARVNVVEKQVFGNQGRQWLTKVPPGTPIVANRGSSRAAVELVSYWLPHSPVALWPHIPAVDTFHYEQVTTTPAGAILVDGRQASSLIFLHEGSVALLRSGRVASYSPPGIAVWEGFPRLALLVEGYYPAIGWLADKGSLSLWSPTGAPLAGVLQLRIGAHRGGSPAQLLLRAPGLRRTVELTGQAQLLQLPVCASSPWRLTFQVKGPGFFHGATMISGLALSAPIDSPHFLPRSAAESSASCQR